MNIQLASETLKFLAQSGVQDYIVCAGARNAAFVKLLGLATGSRTLHFFDERAAGFFALGRARRDSRPVVVITTSGTAAAELLPSAIESFYSGVPLVFITADRPKNFRGTGAPQAIEQVGIFSHYAKESFDVDQLSDLRALKLSSNGLTHLNICFSEPLIDEKIVSIDLSPGEWRVTDATEINAAQGIENQTKDFLASSRRPLVVLGAISSQYRSAVFEQLQSLGAPIYAEAQSGLRESTGLNNLLIQCGAEIIRADQFAHHFDSVIRIGSVPTLRLWRDLEDKLKSTPVLSINDMNFSGLSRDKSPVISYEDWLQLSANLKLEHGAEFLTADKEALSKRNEIFLKWPHSEPAFLNWLSKVIPAKSQIFLGNSLPIREWDLAACREEKQFSIMANRGANGIDGLIATFLGAAAASAAVMNTIGLSTAKENWIILGDLSALYDLNALAFTQFADSQKLRLVIINNGGGQIFKKMFSDPNFINPHKIEFSKWAEMFAWDYKKITSPHELSLEDRPTVLEVCPDEMQTEKFWSQYEGLFT